MAIEGGADLVTFSEAARRVVSEKIAPTMSHQRVSQLSRTDPAFPAKQRMGRAWVADWNELRPYFVSHTAKAAQRDRRRATPPAE